MAKNSEATGSTPAGADFDKAVAWLTAKLEAKRKQLAAQMNGTETPHDVPSKYSSCNSDLASLARIAKRGSAFYNA